jgi:hypothetical protein
MAHNLNQPDELAFIRDQLGLVRGKWLTEEGHQPRSLMEYCPDAGARGIALNHELLIKSRELEKWGCGERVLQSQERDVGVVIPLERLLA